MPTTVNNVETFCHVPHILKRGAAWFKGFGTDKSPGTTLFGVSGHVTRPGLYELPLGTKLDTIIFEHAGGIAGGRKVKGVIPGGMSMPILPADQLDVPMANEFLRERKTMLGTGGIMVMDETTCMVRVGCVISYFFRDESCGQCTQCREGTGWIEQGAEPHRARRRQLTTTSTCCSTSPARWRARRSAPSPTPPPGPCRVCCGTSATTSRRTCASGKCPFPESFVL